MRHKLSPLLISALSLIYGAHANEGFQKGFYAGASLGGSSFKGKRSDRQVSNDGTVFQLSQNASINDTSERGEAFVGYFLPFFQNKLGMSLEGVYAFSSLEDKIRKNLNLVDGLGTYLEEKIKTSRSFGGNFRIGPILNGQHFIGAILGFESTRFTHYHADGVGNEFNRSSKHKIGFQYGLTYQYAWGNSSIGLDLKQTHFSSIKMSNIDSTNAVSTTRFKPKINALTLRYTYRFY